MAKPISVSRQFPFGCVCEKILHELKKRNWQVPGIKVEFDEEELFCVRYVRGQDFELYFYYKPRPITDGAIAFITRIVIPKKQLNVYEDESGPTFYLYVGDNWERDRDKFINNVKVNSKLRKEPRMYLEYKGECHCGKNSEDKFDRIPHTHPRCRPPLLVHTNDLGREYDPEGNEPKSFSTAKVMDEFRQYLNKIVLKKIMSHPIEK
ncbi:MAG: hypothetical protein PHE59_04060 [Patescibacteria group bacterium]|nr:hypothetical protein [Patescibacteria group bacterium]MDD5164682.1 hypothetical protein [Patescibacteria group bacterium]MDD5534996.1 hypothetical protein [Patescibacteria group bacterium]